MTTKPKHQEFIFAVPSALFQDVEGFVTKFSFDELVKMMYPHIVVAQRAGLEKNQDFLQLLPYCIIHETGFEKPTQYLLYQRTKQVGEERLGGKYSIGIGGHIDLSDYIAGNKEATGAVDLVSLDLVSLFESNISREIQEETSVKCYINYEMLRDAFVGCIVDRGDDVGKVHIGLVFTFDTQELLKDTTLGNTVRITEKELVDCGYKTITELNTYDTERWTKILIAHMKDTTLGNTVRITEKELVDCGYKTISDV